MVRYAEGFRVVSVHRELVALFWRDHEHDSWGSGEDLAAKIEDLVA